MKNNFADYPLLVSKNKTVSLFYPHIPKNAKKAVSHLGWKPLFDLDTGLEETYRWVLSHHHSITSADKSYQHKP